MCVVVGWLWGGGGGLGSGNLIGINWNLIGFE